MRLLEHLKFPEWLRYILLPKAGPEMLKSESTGRGSCLSVIPVTRIPGKTGDMQSAQGSHLTVRKVTVREFHQLVQSPA